MKRLGKKRNGQAFNRRKQIYVMEFAMKTLLVFVLLIIGTIVIMLFLQVWTGKSANLTDSAYDFFNSLIGIKQ